MHAACRRCKIKGFEQIRKLPAAARSACQTRTSLMVTGPGQFVNSFAMFDWAANMYESSLMRNDSTLSYPRTLPVNSQLPKVGTPWSTSRGGLR